MSSPTDRTEKHDEHLAYAPKWARDPHHERTHENPNIAEGEFPQHNEQSVPKEGLISDQARAHRPLDPASLERHGFLRGLGGRSPRATFPKIASSHHASLARWIRSS
jgi:hypothetical protein